MDHYVLIPKDSSDLKIIEDNNFVEVLTSNKRYVFPREDVIFLPILSTTTELLAKYIHDKLKEIYKNKKITVRLKESETTTAVYEE
jgi:6-pyruvoyl-tetrahydropterin synthase